MRMALAFVLLAHGIAHLVGFAVPWGIVQAREGTGTTIAGGLIDLGQNGMRAYGVAWLVLAVAFTIAAIMLVAGTVAWKSAVIGITLASVVMCLLSLPLTTIGLGLNAALLIWIAIGGQRGWFG